MTAVGPFETLDLEGDHVTGSLVTSHATGHVLVLHMLLPFETNPSARAIDLVGEEAVASAVVGTLGPVTRPDGSIVWNNRFRWVTATPR